MKLTILSEYQSHGTLQPAANTTVYIELPQFVLIVMECYLKIANLCICLRAFTLTFRISKAMLVFNFLKVRVNMGNFKGEATLPFSFLLF